MMISLAWTSFGRKSRPSSQEQGGHLYGDPTVGRLVTITLVESWLYEFAALEQEGFLQNRNKPGTD